MGKLNTYSPGIQPHVLHEGPNQHLQFRHTSRIIHRVFNDNDKRTSHFQCCVHQLQELGS